MFHANLLVCIPLQIGEEQEEQTSAKQKKSVREERLTKLDIWNNVIFIYMLLYMFLFMMAYVMVCNMLS